MARLSFGNPLHSQMELNMNVEDYVDAIQALNRLPQEASRELRFEAINIAEEIVKPAVIWAILTHTGGIGPKLAQSVFSRRDRIPKVTIGSNYYPRYSGKHQRANDLIGPEPAEKRRSTRSKMERMDTRAVPNMLRYGSITGAYYRRGHNNMWPVNIVKPGWPEAASNKFLEPTYAAWMQAVDQIVYDWNMGKKVVKHGGRY